MTDRFLYCLNDRLDKRGNASMFSPWSNFSQFFILYLTTALNISFDFGIIIFVGSSLRTPDNYVAIISKNNPPWSLCRLLYQGINNPALWNGCVLNPLPDLMTITFSASAGAPTTWPTATNSLYHIPIYTLITSCEPVAASWICNLLLTKLSTSEMVSTLDAQGKFSWTPSVTPSGMTVPNLRIYL